MDANHPDGIYADTSLFCRIEETLSWFGLLQLLQYFGEALRIVTDVERELKGHARGRFRGIDMMRQTPERNEYLRVAATRLPPELALQVGQIAGSWDDAGRGGAMKNHGEVATVLMAQRDGVAAILDDRNGQTFARRRNVTVFATRDVALAMARDGALSEDDASKVWARVFETDSERTHFDAALQGLTGAR